MTDEELVRHVAALQDQFERSIEQQQYAQALPLAREMVDRVRGHVGERDPNYQTALENLAVTYAGTKHFSEAATVFGQIAQLIESRLGPDHPGLDQVLTAWVECYYETGNYRAAEALLRRLVRIREKTPGESLITAMNNLAVTLNQLGKSDEAVEVHLRAAGLRKASDGPRSSSYACALNNLAFAYKRAGDYAAAEPLYVEAAQILAGREVDFPEYVKTRANLAALYDARGEDDQALEIYRELQAAIRHRPQAPPDIKALVLNNQAEWHMARGRNREAKALLQSARELLEATVPDTHPLRAAGLNNLGVFYLNIGDYEAAEHLFKQALEMRRDALGEGAIDVAQTLNNLSEICRSRGDYREAAVFCEQAVEIKKRLSRGPSISLATSVNNLAIMHMNLGMLDEAEAGFGSALEMLRALVGERHPDHAQTLNNLGEVHRSRGDRRRAEPYYRSALGYLRDNYPESKTCQIARVNLAELCTAQGRVDEAVQLMAEVMASDDRAALQILSLTSERQRMSYLADIRLRDMVHLSLLLGHASCSPGVETSLSLVLKRKGLGAEVLAAQRDHVLGGRNPSLQPTLQRLTALRRQIARATLDGPGADRLDAHSTRLARASEERDRLEAELGERIPEIDVDLRMRRADVNIVAAAIPEGAVLIEFVKVALRNFNAVKARGEPIWGPFHYFAYILVGGQPGGVRMHDLGDAGVIERLIAQYRDFISRPPGFSTPGVDVGGRLRAAVFDPLLSALDGRKAILIAPDAQLSLLPFEALPLADGRYLIDDYQVSYLTSGRDVLRFGIPKVGECGQDVVVADPAFNLAASDTSDVPAQPEAASRQGVEIDRGLRFGLLKGTRQEGEEISRLLGITPWLRADALAGRVKALRSPRILHLATHGFFLAADAAEGLADVPGRLSGQGMKNPMLRSGLALAGANVWLCGGSVPPEADGGLLTAEDVTGMDLLNTDLVVLSACETGLGAIQFGEGVLGLRRAFVLAGTRRLVMSLWKVPDAQTKELMVDFYQRILRGDGVASALRGAQLALKGKHPETYYWGAFVCLGDTAALTMPAGQ